MIGSSIEIYGSVQDLYRPVLSMDVPDVPREDTMGLAEYLDAKKFWSEQLKRCLFGWTAPNGVYINAKLYFYLNFVKIPVLDHNGNVIGKTNPLYLKNDHDTLDLIHYSEANKFKNADDIIIAKGRRKHWTYNTHCCILLWDFVFDHDANCGIGYPDDSFVDLGRLFFLEAYHSLHDYFKADKLFPNNQNEVGYAVVRGGGKPVTNNMMYFYPVGRKPGKFRGKMLKRLLFDEVGVLINLLDCLNASTDCVKLGSKKFGQILIGGTSDMITNTSTDYKDIYEKHKNYGFLKHFIPAYQMMEGHINYETGESIVDEAIEVLLKRREDKRLSGNQKFYESEIQENPISEEECFIATGKSLFNLDLVNKQMIVNIQNQREKHIVTGTFEWIYDAAGRNTGRVEFIEDAMGKAHIYLEHVPNNLNRDLFMGAIDDYYKDQSLWSDSLGCCMVYIQPTHINTPSDTVAGIYLERPNTRVEFFNNCIKMLVFFGVGDGKLMLENNDNVGEKHFMDAGYGHLLRWIGKDVGVRLSEPVKNNAIRLGEDYIRSGRLKHIYFNMVLDGIKKVRKGAEKKALNTDVGSTMLLMWLLLDSFKYEYGSITPPDMPENQLVQIEPQIKFSFADGDSPDVTPYRQASFGSKKLFTFSGR